MSFNSVNTNSNAMAALQSLRSAQSATLDASKRLQTGYRVADASDDAGVFAVAQQIRADVGGWDVVAASQARGLGATHVALEGLEVISNLLNDLERKVLEYGDSKTNFTTTILSNEISAILDQIDQVASAARFDGLTPLTSSGATFGMVPTAPVAIGGVLTFNATQPFQVQHGSISGLPPGTPGAIQIYFDHAGVPDIFAVAYRGAVIETSALVAGTGTVSFNWDGGPPYSVEFISGVGVASTASYSVFFDPGGSVAAQAATQFLRDPQGGTEEFRPVDASSAGLGLGAVEPLPAPPGPFTDILNTIEFARSVVGQNSSYFANKAKTFEATRDMARTTIDSYTKGIGATVDADIGRDQARIEASKAREQLALQSTSVANRSQQAILGLLDGLGRR